MSGVKLKEMIKCIKHRLINIFSFSEDVGRLDYFCVWLGSWIFGGGALIIVASQSLDQFLPILVIILAVISFANTCRRLNDIGKSRLLVLLLLVPIVQLIFIVYLMFTPGGKYLKKQMKAMKRILE